MIISMDVYVGDLFQGELIYNMQGIEYMCMSNMVSNED